LVQGQRPPQLRGLRQWQFEPLRSHGHQFWRGSKTGEQRGRCCHGGSVTHHCFDGEWWKCRLSRAAAISRGGWCRCRFRPRKSILPLVPLLLLRFGESGGGGGIGRGFGPPRGGPTRASVPPNFPPPVAPFFSPVGGGGGGGVAVGAGSATAVLVTSAASFASACAERSNVGLAGFSEVKKRPNFSFLTKIFARPTKLNQAHALSARSFLAALLPLT